MTKISDNSMQLIQTAMQKIKGKFGRAFLATLVMVAPLMLLCCTLYATPVAIILFGVLETGYIRYMRALINDENPSIKMMFSEFTNPGLEVFLGAIMSCMFILGTVLLFVPGMVLIGFYSMALFCAEHKRHKSVGEALHDSSMKMNGNFTEMFAYKTTFWFCYVVVLAIMAVSVLGLVRLWATQKLLTIILAVVLYAISAVAWSVITVYYHTTNELFFQELLMYEEKRNGKANASKVEVKEVKAEEKAEVKAPVKKTATPKSAPKAKATTAKTTTTKKTTAKK